MPRWGQFDYDGDTFPVTPPDDWDLDEAIELEREIGLDLRQIKEQRLVLAKGMAWVSIHRVRSAFTIAEAGKLKIGTLGEMMRAYSDAMKTKQPADHLPPGTVLSPTSADTDNASNRGNRRSAAKRVRTAQQ